MKRCLLAILVFGATPLPRAWACDPSPCSGSERWTRFEPLHDIVAPNGAIAFRARRGERPPQESSDLEFLEVTVESEGLEIPGQLDLMAEWDVVWWTPDAALTPATTLRITVSADNDAISSAPAEQECNLPDTEPYEIEVGTTVLAPPAKPVVEVLEAPPLSFPATGIEQLVCCDGSYPREVAYEDECTTDWVLEDDEHCVQGYEQSVMEAQFQLTAENGNAWEPEQLADLAFAVRYVDEAASPPITAFDGEASTSGLFFEPTCLRAATLRYSTGEVEIGDEFCVGEDPLVDLGLNELDIGEDLRTMCETQPYVCEVVQNDEERPHWNDENCELWEPWDHSEDEDEDEESTGAEEDDSNENAQDSGAEEGCSCRTQPHPHFPLASLAVVGLALAWRRRTPSRPLA